MENKEKRYYGIVVRDMRFKGASNEPLSIPYGFLHPETDEQYEALKGKSDRALSDYIKSLADRKMENIQFLLPGCLNEQSKPFAKDNDDVHRGDLVSFVVRVGNNGMKQARFVKIERAFGADVSPFYAEPTIIEAAKELVKGTEAEKAVGILIDEFEDEYDDADEDDYEVEADKEYTDEDYAMLDDPDYYK